MSAGLHSVVDQTGTLHHFFLSEGEELPARLIDMFLANLEANVARVPAGQQEALRQRARELASGRRA